MKYPYILFDLDGTLTDPGLGITNAVIYALEKFGITADDRRSLYKFIGPPLWDSFERFYGFSKEEAESAVRYFREYYNDTGIFENTAQAGIRALLGALRDSGRTLAVATSKPEVTAKRVLEHFDLAGYFTFIGGSTYDGSRVNKDDVIRYVLDSCRICDLSSAVMVGDREHDIVGAGKAGIDSIGVLYGYGCREELQEAGADYIAETVADVGKILLDSSDS
jgi:phosphoglycolate phosphatase